MCKRLEWFDCSLSEWLNKWLAAVLLATKDKNDVSVPFTHPTANTVYNSSACRPGVHLICCWATIESIHLCGWKDFHPVVAVSRAHTGCAVGENVVSPSNKTLLGWITSSNSLRLGHSYTLSFNIMEVLFFLSKHYCRYSIFVRGDHAIRRVSAKRIAETRIFEKNQSDRFAAIHGSSMINYSRQG